jgi:hypothetical protein
MERCHWGDVYVYQEEQKSFEFAVGRVRIGYREKVEMRMTGLEPAQGEPHHPLKAQGLSAHLLVFHVLTIFLKINCARFV